MSEAQLQKMAALFKAVSHPVRLQIVCLLREGELSVGSLLAVLNGCSGANITQHLNILRQQGIITSRRAGNVIYNRVVDPAVLAAIATLEERLAGD